MDPVINCSPPENVWGDTLSRYGPYRAINDLQLGRPDLLFIIK